MRKALKTKHIIVLLAALAGSQVLVLGFRLRRQADLPVPWPTAGDTLPSFTVRRRQDGPSEPFPFGQPRVLLVFDPACPHSEEVAPAWASWLSGPRLEGLSVLALSSEPLEPAVAFANAHEWNVEVAVVEDVRRPSPAWHVLGRTPWVLLVDSNGVIRAEGQGSHLADLVRESRSGITEGAGR